MRVFVSYARADVDRVDAVVQGLRMLQHDVWLDEALIGGQSWWDGILGRIRDCDVFLQAVSRASLKSEACHSERSYALALSRPVLPVLVEHVPPAVLPGDLAPLQFVDYTDATTERAFQLAAALQQRPAAPSLPDPLPEPPEIPLSYLGRLGQEIGAAELSLDQQLALVGRLRNAVERPEDREGALELLNRLQQREDLYAAVARDIDDALGVAAPAGVGASGGRTATVTPPRERTASREDPPQHTEPRRTTRPNPGVYAGATGAGAGTASTTSTAAMRPKTHMGLSILALLFFFPTGIPAVIYAARVNPAWQSGDASAAAKASARAKTWLWVTLVAFVILMIIVAASGGQSSSS